MRNYLLKKCILFSVFIVSQVVFSAHVWAAVEVSFSKIVPLPLEITGAQNIDISIYVDQNKSWDEGQILQRLRQMNKTLLACQWQVANVYVFHLKLSEPAVRKDDLAEDVIYYDGLRSIAKKAQKVTPIQFFYIEKFLNEDSTKKLQAYIISSQENKAPTFLQNTVWFPQTEDQNLMEARAMGALLSRTSFGDIHGGLFSVKQCDQLRIPRLNSGDTACDHLHESLNPLFSTYYNKFGQHYYMTLYCVRNSQNLYKKLIELKPEIANRIYNVLMIHKDPEQSLKPLNARGSATSWSNHSFLVVDGLVLDLDYSKEPQMIPLSEYLNAMWGDGKKDILFLWRPAHAIGGFTNLEVREDFQSRKFPVGTVLEFSRYFSQQACD